MQIAVYNVIIIASKLDKSLVIQKATGNRLSQRTTEMCDKILYEIQGFEILEET
jgi:hypothetical protein